MLGRVLVALLLWLSAWAALDRVVASDGYADAVTARAAAVACPQEAPDSPDDPERWASPHRSSASLTAPAWRSLHHHADLAGASGPPAPGRSFRWHACLRRTPYASRLPYSIPLLI